MVLTFVGESSEVTHAGVHWAAHSVKFHRTGAKRLVLAYEALELPGDCGLRILAYTAEPGSPTKSALDLLASWSSTPSAANQVDR
jgi:MmyB-like transcription regulator ligand binding domain